MPHVSIDIMFGWMQKRSGNYYIYQKRFFKVEGNELKYYADEDDIKPKGIIDLYKVEEISIIENPSVAEHSDNEEEKKKKGYEFMLKVGKREYSVECKNKDEFRGWMDNLNVWMSPQTESDPIPMPENLYSGLYAALRYASVYGAGVEGLFRVPGSSKHADNICQGVCMYGGKYFKEVMPSEYDVFDVGSALKKLLRQLPETLLTHKLVQSFRDANNTCTVHDLIQQLPERNAVILRELSDIWCSLCLHTELTKMTPKNLSISFGPSISNNYDIKSLSTMENLFRIFVEDYDTLFKGITATPDMDPEPLISQMISFLPRKMSRARRLSSQLKMSPRSFGFKGRSRSKSSSSYGNSFSMIEEDVEISKEEYEDLPRKISVLNFSEQSFPTLPKTTASLNLNQTGDSESLHRSKIGSIIFQADEMARITLTNSKTALNEINIAAAKCALLAHRVLELENELGSRKAEPERLHRSSSASSSGWGKGGI